MNFPYFNTVLFWASIITTFVLSVTGWWVMTRALWPNFSARAESRWTHNPVLSFFIGAAVIFLVVIGVQAIGGPGVFVVAAALGLSLSGSAGLAGRIGSGMASPTHEGRAWFRTLKGGIALVLSALVPMLGWFLVLPVMLAGGLGAAILAFSGDGKPKSAENANANTNVSRDDWEVAAPTNPPLAASVK
jgi:hypothetical protein